MNITQGEVKQMMKIKESRVNGNGVRFEIFVNERKNSIQSLDSWDDAVKYARFIRLCSGLVKEDDKIYIKVVLVEIVEWDSEKHTGKFQKHILAEVEIDNE